MINRMIERYKTYSPLEVIMFISIIIASIFIVQGGMQFFAEQKFVRSLQTSHMTAPSLALTKIDADVITQAQLFGLAAPVQQAVPISQLNWVIQGISMSSPQSSHSRVLLKINQTSKWYKAGDTLPENVEIYSINKDNIILKRKGEYETLRLQRNSLQFTKPYQRGGSS